MAHHLKKKYVIVEFDDKSVELLASKWVKTLISGQRYCLWPPYSKKKMSDALKNLHDVEKTWTKYNIQRIFTSTNDYAKGAALAIQATDESTFDELSPDEDDRTDTPPSDKTQDCSEAEKSSGQKTTTNDHSGPEKSSEQKTTTNDRSGPEKSSGQKNTTNNRSGPEKSFGQKTTTNDRSGAETSSGQKATNPSQKNSVKEKSGPTEATTSTVDFTNPHQQSNDTESSSHSSSSSDESNQNNVTVKPKESLTKRYQMFLRINQKQDEMVKAFNLMKVEFEEVKQCLMLNKPVKATDLMTKFSKTFSTVLPLPDEGSLQKMEKELEKPENLKLLNEWMLVTCGGTTLKDYISDVLKKILANDLALQYSGQGRRNVKKNFSALRLHESLTCRAFSAACEEKVWAKESVESSRRGACLDKFPSCGGSKEVTAVVSQFLVGARDRGDARVARIARAVKNKTAADAEPMDETN